MVRVVFSDIIVKQNGKITRFVTATWNKTRTHGGGSMYVYRIDENGTEYVRDNLCFFCMGGYFVDLEGHKTWSKIDGGVPGLKSGSCFRSEQLTKAQWAKMVELHPEFKWTLQKAGNVTCARAMTLLMAWKRNPKTELLVGAKLERLVNNKAFERMTNEKQKAVLSFIRKTEGADKWPLNKILFVLNGRTAEDWDKWQEWNYWHGRCAFDVYKYLNEVKTNLQGRGLLGYYQDYIRTAKNCGHDVEDKYWKFPKNLGRAHNKVVAEYNNILEARRLEAERLHSERERNKKKNFVKMAGMFSDKVLKRSGLIVSVPDTIKAVSKQAKALHQCLVSADYIGRMAERELLLVFITTKTGEPVATAEIKPDGTLGQFYADEDADDMKPTAKAQKALDAWMDKFKPNWKEVA